MKTKKSWWNSVRSIIAFIVVISVCVFVSAFTYLGKIEGKDGLQVLEGLAVIVIAFYFSLKKRPDPEK